MKRSHLAHSDAVRTRSIAKLLLLGIAIVVLAFAVSCYVQSQAMASLAQSATDTLRQQCSSYDRIVVADRTKSLFRLSDMMEELSGELGSEGAPVSDEYLEAYVSDNRISGIAVLDGDLRLEASGYTRQFQNEGWADSSLGASIADIVDYPAKVFADRISVGDDYYDVCAVSRKDARGIVVGFYKQPTGLVANTENDLASLLTGLRLEREGDYVIAEGGVVRAASDASLNGASAQDNAMVAALSSMTNDFDLHFVEAGQGAWWGYRSASGSYDLYVYYPLSSLFTSALISAGVVGVAFLVLCLGYFAIRNRELYKNQAKLQVANDAKSEFLRRISHDIRTPINGIKGYVDLAQRHPNDLELQQKCRDNEMVALDSLMMLVNSVLDMVKLEGNEVVLDHAPFDLEKLLEDVRTVLQPQAQARAIECSVGVDSDSVATHLIGSPRHVAQIFTNLLGNAVKYGKPGGYVRLRARLVSREGSKATYEFACEDNGIGMSREFQSRMFEPFSQESSSARTVYEGSGLGLSIVKRLADAMGGSVEVSSEKGVGTTFVVRLAFEVDEAAPEAPVEDASGSCSLEGMNILLVEDNELNMEIAELMLVDAGANVTKAWNGKEALEAFAASKPGEFDAIITDIMMPVMDGLEEARAIRALERPDAKTVLILAASANAFADDAKASLDAGINMHLAKPIDSDKVQRAIAKARAK